MGGLAVIGREEQLAVSRHIPTAGHGPAGFALAQQTSFRNGAPVVRVARNRGIGEPRASPARMPASRTREQTLERAGR